MSAGRPAWRTLARVLAEQVIYEQTERAIVQQQESLASVWTRVGILLSVAAIATSVLGGQALRDESVSCWGILAIIAFAGIGVMAMAILWPREWTFRHDTAALLADFEGDRSDDEMAAMYKALAESAEIDYDANQTKIDVLLVLFQISGALLVIEVGLWLGELGLG